MKKIFIFILVLLFAGCASSVNNAETSLHVDEKSNGKIISITTNQKVIVKLQGNPTTGFAWYQKVINSALFTLVKKEYTPDNNDKKMTGVGGVYTFEFLTQRVGKVDLDFEYTRSWEAKTSAKTFKVTLDIK